MRTDRDKSSAPPAPTPLVIVPNAPTAPGTKRPDKRRDQTHGPVPGRGNQPFSTLSSWQAKRVFAGSHRPVPMPTLELSGVSGRHHFVLISTLAKLPKKAHVAARGCVRPGSHSHLLIKERPVGVVSGGDHLVVGGVLQHKSEPEFCLMHIYVAADLAQKTS